MDDLRTAHVTKLDGRTVASAHNPGDGRHILRKFFAMHPKGPCVVCPESPRSGDRTKRCVARTNSG